MKLEKFYLCSEGAERRVAKRMGIRRLSPSDIRYLLGVKRLGMCTASGVCEYVYRFYPTKLDSRNAWNNLRHLCDIGFLVKDGHHYSLSPRGREYLSYLRNYYVNKRL